MLVLGAAALLAATPRADAQSHTPHRIPAVSDELLARAVPIRSGIGRAHDAVHTASAEAQAFYDQGLTYLHSYEWIEAARSFNQALRIDPALALAHAGLSVAYTELNAPQKAQAAIDRAQALSATLPEHDRLHIDARSRQMAAEASPGSAALLTAYRQALDTALARFPRDVELILLRGVAESSDPADRGQGSVAASVKYFQQALTLAPGHFAAHHFLTHAYENSGRTADALANAAAYAKASPAVPHALHMHGHVLRRVGRIADAVAAFEEAERLETAYFTAEKIPSGLYWHHEHNLDLLASSYQYLGQMKRAEPLLRKAFDLPSTLAVQMFNKRAWPAYLVSRGRTAAALDAAAVLIANPSPLVRAIGHVEAGHAHLASKRFAEAAASTNAALKELRASPAAGAVVGLAFQGLQGEFFLRTNEREKGRSILKEVVARVRALPGPDNWVQALFTLDSVARAARESGDWEFAAWAAAQMIEHDPNYAGSHYASALVAEHNKDQPAARAAFARAAKLWASADPDLPELLAIRQRGK